MAAMFCVLSSLSDICYHALSTAKWISPLRDLGGVMPALKVPDGFGQKIQAKMAAILTDVEAEKYMTSCSRQVRSERKAWLFMEALSFIGTQNSVPKDKTPTGAAWEDYLPLTFYHLASCFAILFHLGAK